MTIHSRMSADQHELTINIEGRFDFSQHQAFRSSVDQAAASVQSYVVDLGRSDYMDSAALGMLLLLLDKAGGQKGKVKIVNANKDVKKILQIANFDKLFTLS